MQDNKGTSYRIEGGPDAQKIITGLFGSSGGNSTWRQVFIEEAERRGWWYFNPQLKPGQWSSGPAWFKFNEQSHLSADRLILFVIDETSYALGSLMETGYSILQTLMSLQVDQNVVLLITPDTDPVLCSNEELRKESFRGRALTGAKIAGLSLKNVYQVQTIDEMFQVWSTLHDAMELRERVAPFMLANLNLNIEVPEPPRPPTLPITIDQQELK